MGDVLRRNRPHALVYQRIVDTLRVRIHDGEWQPGQRVPTVAELSKELNVGQSSVREALRILGNEQLLRIEQGRGIFVADAPKLPPALFDHLAMSAEVTLADEDIAIITNAAREMDELVLQGQEHAKPDLLMHRQIAQACGNPMLQKMTEVLLDLHVEGRARTALIPGVVQRSTQYHLLIATAIEEHDASRAEALMRAHLDDIISVLQRAARNFSSVER